MVSSYRAVGVTAILVTPFNEDDSLDLPGLAVWRSYTIGLGAHGVGIGLASEYLSLSDEECVAVARTVATAVRGRVPVVMSCARPSTAATIDPGPRRIRALWVDALMVLPPYVLPPSADGLAAHYRAVARAVDTPIVVQDAPHMSGATLNPELLAALLREEPGIQYLKIETVPSVPKIARLADLLVRHVAGERGR